MALWQCCPAEAAISVTSLPSPINYKNTVQVLIAPSLGGGDCGLLNRSLMASSPRFAGLTPLLHSPLWLHSDTTNVALCSTAAEAAQKIILTSQTISVRQCS